MNDNMQDIEKKKSLFLQQIDTMNIFLKNGAITQQQYNTSFNGLVTKMNITEEQLKDWLHKDNK